MIILENENKSIKLKLNDNIKVISDNMTGKLCYQIELPIIICSEKKDAETIQQEVNTFVHKLGNDILGNKKE